MRFEEIVDQAFDMVRRRNRSSNPLRKTKILRYIPLNIWLRRFSPLAVYEKANVGR